MATGYSSCEFDELVDLLFHLDKDITMALQYLRPDLLFMHAAALGCAKRVALLSAPPGTGKSTLTLVALGHGLDYLSDELAPIDLRRLTVEAYPRSVFLKSPPPLPHRLPDHAIAQNGRYYVSYSSPVRSEDEPRLAALIFLRRDDERFAGLRKITAASGAARVIANALNLLAHPSVGVDAAIQVTRIVPCFELDTTDLDQASAAIKSVLATSASLSRLTGQRPGSPLSAKRER
jgi:hypothetical protein